MTINLGTISSIGDFVKAIIAGGIIGLETERISLDEWLEGLDDLERDLTEQVEYVKRVRKKYQRKK